MRYTVHDTPEVVRRIEHDLALIQFVVRANDPGLRSLVLTGGFARGEGAVRGGAPQNDYDLVAVRGWRPTREPYTAMQDQLSERLGLHVDLAPVPTWRLRWVQPSIFWYETATRGRTLWGEDLLGRIRVRRPEQIHPAEGMRLLVNRAAGLLLCTPSTDPDAKRLQAAKALLAALDAHMLAAQAFAPSQGERWVVYQNLARTGALPRLARAHEPWFDWAYHHKVDPDNAPPHDAQEAWFAARSAILDAVPVALAHAGLPSLESYGRRDGLVDHVVYYRRSAQVPGARRLTLHPTGRVRVATIRLLEASAQGSIEPAAAAACFRELVDGDDHPVRRLDALRRATLQ